MKKLLWIDLEMTGLDEHEHHIIEVAAIVTNLNLENLEEYHEIVFQPPEILAKMDEWCQKTHGDSGLTAAIPNGKPSEKVETELIALIDRHFRKGERVLLAGNSVGNDKRFIDYYWKSLAERLHYRIVDVSSFKEIFRDRYSMNFAKKNTHRALDDINESIRELSFYLSSVDPEKAKAANSGDFTS